MGFQQDGLKSKVFKGIANPDKFEDGRNTWHAFCPALKGCRTWGHTREEAIANIREAILLCLQKAARVPK